MKKSLGLFLILSLILGSTVGYAEDESPWSTDTSFGVFSHYVFRGLMVYDGPSLQPSLTENYDTGAGVLSANLWMHITGDSGNQAERFTELDETLKYSYTAGIATISVGNAWYTYSDLGDGSDIEDTAEVFGSVALDTVLTPTLSVYHDWRALHAQYYELGLSHEFAETLGGVAPVTPFVAFGFGSHGEKVYADDGLVQVTAGVSSNIEIGTVTLAPTVDYSFKVDDNTVNQLWFGMSLNYSF